MATLTISSLLSLAFLLPENDGRISLQSKARRTLPLFAALWFVAALGNSLSILADLFDQSIASILDLTTIRSFFTQTALGRVNLIEVLAALFVFIFASSIKKNGGAVLLLVLSLIGVVAPVFESHSSALGSHALAIGSLVVHVIALELWIGSVVGLYFMGKNERELAKSRVANIALWSSIAVACSGVANAWTRLRISSDWFSTYGALIALKVVLFAIVLLVAARLRRNPNVRRLIQIEVLVLLLITSIGSVLNRFVPINSGELTQPVIPSPPNLMRVAMEYDADGLILGALILSTALYIKGVIVLSRRGDSWPKGRTLSFAIGIALLDFATSGGVGFYAKYTFEYHMVAHMILSMIAPIALVLSAPITLALRTLPSGRVKEERGLKALLVAFLHSRYVHFITHPIAALALFDGSLFALYFTPLFGKLMSSHSGHLLMNLHFIAVGLLFFHVIVGIDPNPRKVHHLARIVMLLAAMSIHSFFSVALMSSNSLIDNGYFASLNLPWNVDLLSNQKTGAAIGWAMGEIPIVAALIATFIQWMRSDARDARRADKRSEVDLAEYNAYLAQLSARENKSEK